MEKLGFLQVLKVNNIQVAGVARMSLTPLVTETSGFGAAIILLRCARGC